MASSEDYWDALTRLINNDPKRIPKGSNINKDTVALEAGRGRGAIKGSRRSNSKLVAAINAAAIKENTNLRKIENKNIHLKGRVSDLKKSKQDDLNRELMLLNEIYKLKRQLSELKCNRPDCPLFSK